MKEADYVVIESTYGNRVHGAERPDYVGEFARILKETFDKGGNVVVPSFAVGRTQELLYFIREIKEKDLIPEHSGFHVGLGPASRAMIQRRSISTKIRKSSCLRQACARLGASAII